MYPKRGSTVRTARSNRYAPGASVRRVLVVLITTVSVGFVVGVGSDVRAAEPVSSEAPAIEIVETWPVETELDSPEIPDAHEVWLSMIEGATERLDFAQFYASNSPDSRLELIVQAVEAAADRGVRVRFLAEERFYQTYPGTLDRLGGRDGIEMRRFDVRSIMGGVLHAKYFIVDGREVYVGSQNFDWRALAHIQELGVRVRVPEIGQAFSDVFNLDWSLAAGIRLDTHSDDVGAPSFPAVVVSGDDTLRVTPVFSPQDFLPDGAVWDLPRLVDLLDSAQQTARLQLLTYRTVSRDGTYFDSLESALRRAAARGVKVQLLLADWGKRPGTIEGLQSLQALQNVEVKLATIPEWSGGFIPYARVIHAKYLVVDGTRSWIGTSNWEKSYFFDGRNAGLTVDGAPFGATLDGFFLKGWTSPYSYDVDPGAHYEVPRIGE